MQLHNKLTAKAMKYLVITENPITGEKSAFYTNWFDADKHFNPECNMIVVDRTQHLVTFDGETWNTIETDNL